MKRITLPLAIAILIPFKLSATVYKVFDGLQESVHGSGIQQSLAICDKTKFESMLTENTRALLSLPKPKNFLLDPEKLFESEDLNVAAVGEAYDIMVMEEDKGRIATIKTLQPQLKVMQVSYNRKSALSYVALTGLHECIGITYHSTHRKIAGGLHLSLKSFKMGLFTRVVEEIKKKDLTARDCSDVNITLTSSFFTPYLDQVVALLKTNKFKIVSVDIPHVFLTCENWTCSGTKYMPLESTRLKPEDLRHIANTDDFSMFILTHPEFSEIPRSVLMEISTGQTCRLIKKGESSGNDLVISYITGQQKQIPYPPTKGEKLIITRMLIEKLKAKKKQDEQHSQAAFNKLQNSSK